MNQINVFIESRLTKLETTQENIQLTLQRLENKMENNFSEFRKENMDLRKESREHFRWIMGAIFLFIMSPIFLNLLKAFNLVQ